MNITTNASDLIGAYKKCAEYVNFCMLITLDKNLLSQTENPTKF